MPRLIRPVVEYVAEVMRATAQGWNAFWFTPASPSLLGVLRILTGISLVYTHAVWGLALEDFYGPHAWIAADLMRDFTQTDYIFTFWLWLPPGWMWPAYAASMAVFVLFTVGLFTRLTSVLALFLGISFAYRVPAALFGLDQINLLLALYLAIGPSGRALSVDRWLARRRGRAPARPAPSVSANLALRLIQVHMCVIYFTAGATKLQGTAWWNGEAMWLAFASLEYQSRDMTWTAAHPYLINLMTHITVIWELSFCVMVWFRLWRPIVLFMAVVLHFGIGDSLGMWTFGLIMLVGCAAFLPPDIVERLTAWARPPSKDKELEADQSGARARGRSRSSTSARAAGTPR